jgi:hypothetical protein
MLGNRLRRYFAKIPPPQGSVFYSLAPGLGKLRSRPFLRNGCRQLSGNFRRSAHEVAQTVGFQLRCRVARSTLRVFETALAAQSQFGCRPSTVCRPCSASDIVCLSIMQSKPASSWGRILSRIRNRAVRGRNLPLPTRRAMLRVPIITGGCGVMSSLIHKFRTWHCAGTFGAIT